MERKRFIVELGTGIDLHGEDVTEAAVRAVKDAVSKSCLCGLMEILEIKDINQIEVDVLVAAPKPDEVDVGKVKEAVPIGGNDVTVVEGGMTTDGLCVDMFAPDCDKIVVVNVSLTVFIKPVFINQ
ncbi:MAG: Lin0512 family protein [Deltaproteobacteria bacterium]|jgi:uncharacterized protein (TIGR02058 family)|nr:Lin0512 family protein [Deltaproteobacteria bacterium]